MVDFFFNYVKIRQMSSSKDNNVFKKTSFLQGNNSAFIEEFYSQYIENPETLPESWRTFSKV